MSRVGLALLAAIALPALAVPAAAQQQRPQIETKKVDGTEGVYIFRNGNHQAMFVVTRDGVIATDPDAYGHPTGGAPYVAAKREVKGETNKEHIFNHQHSHSRPAGPALQDEGAKSRPHQTQ